MAERSVVIRLKAEVADYRRRMREAGDATKGVGDAAVKSAQTNRAAWDTAGTALAAFGAVSVGALALSARSAIEWESAWAGVSKTVDGTTGEMAALEGELRSLARSLPATHGEIAAVAEAAGQLGIAREDVAGFTRTMVDLGETTNLSADEAATSIAQMMNVMQTAPEDVGRLGATLVALGNAGASTEKQIIEMAQRISGAAAVVGMTEGEVLAFANAVASMGIEVESGGTSVSRVLTDMSKAAQSGGEELEVFARTAGMSAEEFARSFTEDPAEAFASFIDGLGGVQEAGGNVFAVLDELGLSDVRVSQALLGMASSGDLLRDSLELQGTAWADNTALVEEAAKRYDTTASKIAVAKNNIADAAITFGEILLPAIVSAAEAAADFAGWMAQLPEPVQEAAVGLAAVAGGASLAGGAFLLTFPRVVDTYTAFQDLARIQPNVASGLKTVGKAAGAAAAIAVVAAAANDLIHSFGPVAPTLEEATAALLNMEDAADLDDLFANNIAGVDSFIESASRIEKKNPLQVIGDFALGVVPLLDLQGRSMRQATDDIEGLDDALALMASSGNVDLARDKHEELSGALRDAGYSAKQVSDLFPELEKALTAVATEEELATAAAAGHATAMGGVGDVAGLTVPAIEEATEALEEWRAELQTVGQAFVEPLAVYKGLLEEKTAAERASAEASAETQNLSIADQIDALRRRTDAELAAVDSSAGNAAEQKTIIENRRDDEIDALGDQEKSWEDYVSGVKVSLGEFAQALQEQIANQEEWRANLVAITQRGGLEFGQIMAAMGVEGADIVAELRDAGDEEFGAFRDGMIEDARLGGEGAAAALDQEMRVMAAVAAAGSKATVAGIAKELGIGTAVVAGIASQYGVKLAAGVNPLLSALGRPQVQINRNLAMLAEGGVLGGRENHVAQIGEAGGPIRVWKEPETGGESYIPLSPSKRGRSTDIWRETGRRLGVQGFADGGFAGDGDDEPPFFKTPFQKQIKDYGRLYVRDVAPRFSIGSAAAAWDNISGTDLDVLGGVKPDRRFAQSTAIEKDLGRSSLYGRAYYGLGQIHLNSEADRTPSQRRATAIHEIGHILGLPHPNNQNSIMAVGATKTKTGPTGFDIANLRELYPAAVEDAVRALAADTNRSSGFSVNLPKPPSTAPYGVPLSTAADAAMSNIYDAAWAFAEANREPQASPGSTSGLGPRARAASDFVRSNWDFGGTIGGYANRNIAGTNKRSKHAEGKAIDVMTYGNTSLGQEIADYFAGPGRSRFGVDNTIFNRRIWNLGAPGGKRYTGQNPHTDHPHIDFYKEGGIFNPHIRDKGGPLRPGFTYNGTGGLEEVVSPLQGVKFIDSGARGTAPSPPESRSTSYQFEVKTERTWTPAEALQLIARAEAMYGL